MSDEQIATGSSKGTVGNLMGRWYLWFIVAAVLFAVGLGALALLGDGTTATGEEDTSLLAGVAYFGWLLSWAGAIVSAGLGVVAAVKRRSVVRE